MGKFKRILLYIFSIPYVKHPLIAIGAIILLIIVFFLSLNLFTRHGDEYPLPDFTEMPLAEARKVGKELNLRLVVTDSTYVMTKAPGSILSQQPHPGDLIKKGRRIFITLNSLRPQMVPVPDVVNESLRQALIELDRNGLIIGKLTFTTELQSSVLPDTDTLYTSDTLEAYYEQPQHIAVDHLAVKRLSHSGKILAKGDSVAKGSQINLNVGLDPREGIEGQIPALEGMSLNEARVTLARSLFNVGRVTYDKTIESIADSLAARVWLTNPSKGMKRKYGSAVDINLTLNTQRIAFQ